MLLEETSHTSLVIDIGNTRTKYAYFVADTIKEKGCIKHKDIPIIVSKFSAKTYNMMFSSVKVIPKKVLLESMKFNPNIIILSSQLATPIKTLYETPESLGADRIALIAGAAFEFLDKPVLIIDAGTCITYDFVNHKTQHLGGAISPGLQLRLKALSTQTALLPRVNASHPKDLIGSTTQESILSGVVNGVINEINGTIENYQKRYPKTVFVLTGGDANFFDKKLKNSIFVDEDILLKGMHFILKTTCKKANLKRH